MVNDLERRGGAVDGRAVPVRGAVQHAGERRRVDGGRVVARLQDAGQALLPQPLELVVRERRPERDVGHQRQRIGQPRDRHVQPHGRRVDAGRGGQVGAEEIDRVGELERRARAGALVEHRRRQRRDAELARRIVGAAAQHHEIDLRDRHLVQLDEPDRQAVRQLPLLDRRQLNRRRRAGLRRPRAVGRLGAERRGKRDSATNASDVS